MHQPQIWGKRYEQIIPCRPDTRMDLKGPSASVELVKKHPGTKVDAEIIDPISGNTISCKKVSFTFYAILDQSKGLGNSPMSAKQQKLHPSKVPGRETLEWPYSRVPQLQTGLGLDSLE